jgi:hypothetical protein
MFYGHRDRSIDELLSEIRVEGWPKPIGALAARLTIEMAGSLESVWAGLHDVKKALVESSARLEKALVDASDSSGKADAALVRWTKVLVFATIAYTLLTGGLLIATILKRP